MTNLDLDALFGSLRRFPDVEAPNLQAYDATDRLLLETAGPYMDGPGTRIAVIGDRHGALSLGALAGLGVDRVRVTQDLYSGRLALQRNARATGLADRLEEYELGPELLADADVVLMQLPKSLAELEEIADVVARHASHDAVLLAGGRIKHMTTAMNSVLERRFAVVQPQLARQKSRVLIATGPRSPEGAQPYPVRDFNTELSMTVCAHGAAFSGNRLDIGTRFLLHFLDRMPDAPHAVDLGCGTGILACKYALHHPQAQVTATDQSAAAVASAKATADANGLGARVRVVHDDAMSTFPDASSDLILLNPPFHLAASVHAGAAVKMFEAAARVLRVGGELWTVYNSHLQYRSRLERLVGPTIVEGRNPKFTVTRSRKG